MLQTVAGFIYDALVTYTERNLQGYAGTLSIVYVDRFYSMSKSIITSEWPVFRDLLFNDAREFRLEFSQSWLKALERIQITDQLLPGWYIKSDQNLLFFLGSTDSEAFKKLDHKQTCA